MKTLKLFIWEDVLEDYTSGVMFALAENVDEARKRIIKKCEDKGGYPFGKFMEDLSSDPIVIDKPEGFYLYGGG